MRYLFPDFDERNNKGDKIKILQPNIDPLPANAGVKNKTQMYCIHTTF